MVAELPALFDPDTVVVTMINGVPWWYFHGLAGAHEGRAVTSVDADGAGTDDGDLHLSTARPFRRY